MGYCPKVLIDTRGEQVSEKSGTIAQSGNWTLKASRAMFNTVGGLGETRAEGDGDAAALQGRDTCGAGAPAVPGPGSVGRHGAPRPLCRCPLGARWAQAARASRHAQREGLALHPAMESRQNNLSNLPSPSFAVSRTSHESWIGCYGEPPMVVTGFCRSPGIANDQPQLLQP